MAFEAKGPNGRNRLNRIALRQLARRAPRGAKQPADDDGRRQTGDDEQKGDRKLQHVSVLVVPNPVAKTLEGVWVGCEKHLVRDTFR